MMQLTKLTRRGLPLLTVALLAGASCKGKSEGGGASPNDALSKDEIDQKRKEAAEQAKTAGLVDLANKDLENGRYVSARKRAEEALAQNPNDADAHVVLGAAAWRAGDYDASTAAYRKAIELDPKNFGAIDGLGRNLQAAGDHAEAMRLQDVLIATERDGFSAAACGPDTECTVGWCDQEAKQCQPTRQARPRITKLWSQYLLLDADAAVATADEIFVGSTATEQESAIVRPFVGFVRPLAGKGPFVTIEGSTGNTDLDIDAQGFKHFSTTVNGEYSRSIFFELLNETRISTELAATLDLKPVGKVTPFAMPDEMDIVIVPEVKIGELTIKQVPALVTDLSAFASIGETPGLVLGRQVMQRFGAITFDFPGRQMTVSVDAGDKPADAAELPLLVIDSLALRVPITKVGVDGSDEKFWAWVGGSWQAALAITAKAYLKAGHRPGDIDPPDDPNAGLKMVYLDKIDLGGAVTQGMGGYVLTNTPADPTLTAILEGSGFEVGGYLNVALLKMHKATYLLPQGKMWLSKPAG